MFVNEKWVLQDVQNVKLIEPSNIGTYAWYYWVFIWIFNGVFYKLYKYLNLVLLFTYEHLKNTLQKVKKTLLKKWLFILNTRKNGYIRVSRKYQNRQLEAMKQHITDEQDVFIEKQSRRDFNRDQYQRFQTHQLFEQYQLLS